MAAITPAEPISWFTWLVLVLALYGAFALVWGLAVGAYRLYLYCVASEASQRDGEAS